MPYVEDIPEWMAGDWDIFSETGEYIGRCEIDSYSIEIQPQNSYEIINILDNALQSGGWTETSNTIYIIYVDASMEMSYTFKQENESISMTVWTTSDTYTYILKDRS